MNEILLVAGMAAVTFAVRYIPLVITGRIDLPERAFRVLRYVPVAVLTAITVPAMLMPTGDLQIGPGNAYLVGGLAAIAAAWWSKKLLPTIVIGMAVFAAWRLLVA